MTLNEAQCGDLILIKDIKEDEDILKKIMAMGLRKGSQFEVYMKCGRNLLLRNGTNCFIISNKLAEKIEIELLAHKPEICEDVPCNLSEDTCPKGEDICIPNRKRKRKGWHFFKKVCPFFTKE